MQITDLALPDVKLVQLKVHGDSRGFFLESYKESDWRPILGNRPFIQDNQSVFVRLMNRPAGDAAVATKTIERVVDLLGGFPELNEFKHTSISH